MFDTYIAFDPSLWWNEAKLLDGAAASLRRWPKQQKTLYFASSDEKGIVVNTERLAETLKKNGPATLRWHYERMPLEKHSTIYHPAAVKAFRAVLAPRP